MRLLAVAVVTFMWAGAVSAQETVAVTAHVTIPDFLWLTAEPETVVEEREDAVVRQVRLHVKANRTWSLLVACGGEQPAADGLAESGEDGNDGAAGSGDTGTEPPSWRRVGTDGPFQSCAGGEPARAADGGRGNHTLVVLEYVAPRDLVAEPLLYTLVPR